MLRYLTAGESHGRALVAIVEGLPAGLPVVVDDIGGELARRRLGYGRGPRMRFEQDEVTIVGGVRHGRTLGSPVAVEIANTEWNRSDKWHAEMAVELEKFGIPVRNAVGDLSSKEFYSPGSMLRVDFDPSNPLAYGMPDEGLVMFDDSPAFEVISPSGISIAATYPEGNLLQSGWLDGESHIAGKSALLSVAYGEGRLVLIGFGPQTRAETHGSYKVLFNSLYLDE